MTRGLGSYAWLPIVVAIGCALLIWLGYSAVERRWRERVGSELSAVVDREVEAVRAAGAGQGAFVGGFGGSGDTIVFDAEARILFRGRASDDDPSVDFVRNPGGDTTTGFSSLRPRERQPLTLMARAATEGNDGMDLDGYRDHRGVPVVGTWRWLPDRELGVAAELPMTEAYGGLYLLYFAIWVTFALLVAVAAGGFAYLRVVAAWQQQLRRAQRLGQYTLQSKLGEGGMGAVYLAKHALLRRPTAIKLIRGGDHDEVAIARFEREVQYTSQLTHPNTIAVYDYGRTPEGTFYYAMEHLSGLDCRQVVEVAGPLPEERVVHLLQQVCGSLGEAHAAELVHRDIKPGNVMVCERGGIADFVKVLDFGLARTVGHSGDADVTQASSITGTPHYISPEAIEDPESVDARSDLYAVGALAYFLLTGETVFTGKTSVVICSAHLREEPEPPSKRLGTHVDPTLEEWILRCLAKRPDDRPASAEELSAGLSTCARAGAWTEADARAWWSEHGDAVSTSRAVSQSGGPKSVVVDVAGRVRSTGKA